MQINTPNPDTEAGPIVKNVVVGGGITFKIEGFRYSVEGEVLEINEADELVRVKNADFEGWVPKRMIKDSKSPEEHTFQGIYDNNVSDTHRTPAEIAYSDVEA